MNVRLKDPRLKCTKVWRLGCPHTFYCFVSWRNMVEFIVLHDNSSTLKDTLLDVISEQHIQTISIVNDSQCCVFKPQTFSLKVDLGIWIPCY